MEGKGDGESKMEREDRYERLKMEIGSQPIHEKLFPSKAMQWNHLCCRRRCNVKCLISHDKGINCVLIFLMHNIPPRE